MLPVVLVKLCKLMVPVNNMIMKRKMYAQSSGEWAMAIAAITVTAMAVVLSFAPHMTGVLQSITEALNAPSGVSQTTVAPSN